MNLTKNDELRWGLKDNHMPFTIKHKGSFKNTERFLSRAKRLRIQAILSRYGNLGVSRLSNATPIDSGETANLWGYRINKVSSGWEVEWHNDNSNGGVNVAILIQYGHGTGTGGYVPPNDFINPAITPILDEIGNAIWKEVSAL